MVSKGPSHGVRQVWPGPDMMPTVDVDKEGDEDETGDVQVAVWRGLFAKRRRELVTPQWRGLLLLPAALQEWLPDDHLAYFISDVVDQLDVSEVTARYESWVVWFSMLNSGQPWYGTLEGDGNRIRLKVK